MSVPAPQRDHGKLEACVKALELAKYTLKITANKKIFTLEYQTALTDKIISAALNIYTLAWTANNILVNSPDDLVRRLSFQEQAAIQCNILLSLMDIAQGIFHLSTKRIVYWGKKTIEARNLIRAWRDADRKRYGARFKGQ